MRDNQSSEDLRAAVLATQAREAVPRLALRMRELLEAAARDILDVARRSGGVESFRLRLEDERFGCEIVLLPAAALPPAPRLQEAAEPATPRVPVTPPVAPPANGRAASPKNGQAAAESEVEADVLEALESGPLPVAELAAAAGYPVEEVEPVVMRLARRGQIERTAGGYALVVR